MLHIIIDFPALEEVPWNIIARDSDTELFVLLPSGGNTRSALRSAVDFRPWADRYPDIVAIPDNFRTS